MTRLKKITFLVIVFVIIAGFGYFIYRDLEDDEPAPLIQEADVEGSVCSINSDDQGCEIPDLDKKIIVKGNFTGEQKTKYIKDIQDIRAQLKEDSDYLQNWIQLGLLYKLIEDYPSAAEAWEYATAIRPNDAIAFHNLGDLYAFYLPDYPRAENNYLKAIEINPAPFYYQKLYEFYIYTYTEKTYLAEDLLRKGLEKNPGDELLSYLLNEYLENQ